MANVNVITSPYIVSGETSITDNVFKDNGTDDMVKGGLYVLAAGVLSPVETTQGTAQVLDTGTAPFNAAARYFISMQDKTADGGFVSVTEITEDSTLEGFVVGSATDTVVLAQTAIGTAYAGYVNTAGLWAVDNNTSNGIFRIVDVDSNYDPYRNPDSDNWDEDAGGVRHGRVKFKLVKTLLA